jgi:hypothetical protein
MWKYVNLKNYATCSNDDECALINEKKIMNMAKSIIKKWSFPWKYIIATLKLEKAIQSICWVEKIQLPEN